MKKVEFRFSCNYFFGVDTIEVNEYLSKQEIIEQATQKVKNGHRKPTLTELERCYNKKCSLKIIVIN